MATQYIKTSNVRQFVNGRGKRCDKSFISALDRYIYEIVERSLSIHNGGRKTMDRAVLMLAMSGGKI